MATLQIDDASTSGKNGDAHQKQPGATSSKRSSANQDEGSTALEEALKLTAELQEKQSKYIRHIGELEMKNRAQKEELQRKQDELKRKEALLLRKDGELRKKAEELVELHVQLHVSSPPSSPPSTGNLQKSPTSHVQVEQPLEEHGAPAKEQALILQLQRAIDIKDGELEEHKSQLEAKDRVILTLEKEIHGGKRGKKAPACATTYEEQVALLTQMLSRYEESDKQQNQEIAQLRTKLHHAEDVDEQIVMLTANVSTLEQEKEDLQKELKQTAAVIPQPEAGIRDHAYLQKLREEINRLRPLKERVHSLEQHLEAREKRHQERKAKNQTLQQKLEALEQEHKELKSSVEVEVPKEVHELQASLKEEKKEIRTLQEKLSSLEKASSELSKMQLHAKEQSRKMLELKQKLQAVEVGREEEQASTNETLYNLQDEIQRLTDDQQAVREEKQHLQEELDSTEAQNEELVAEVQQLERESRKLRDNIKKLSQLSVQDAQMQKILDEKQVLLSALQKEKEDIYEELQDDIQRLTEDQQAVRRDKQYLQEAMEATKTRNEELVAEVRKLQWKIDEQQTLLAAVQKEKECLLKEKQEHVEELQTAKAERKRYMMMHQAEHEKCSQRASEVLKLQNDFEQRMSILRNELAIQQTEKAGLQARVDELTTSLHQKESTLLSEREVRQELQTQIADLQAQGDELVPYILPAFTMLEGGQFRGSGSYGSVHMVEVSGSPCIAKRLHDILVGRGNEEQISPEQSQSIQRKFRQECILLSRLRHPNIVQFIGVLQSRDPSDLTLVMECLHMDLDRCLRTYRNISLPIKLSILLDISYGLLYLHSQQPSIIHRDLTAANILLTTDMKAKIAYLGVSKILDLHPQQVSLHTRVPGTLAYMPPEALKRNPDYNTKLDDFSLGVVTLYVAIQEFPFVSEEVTVTAVQNKEVQIRKRIAWIEMILEPEQCLQPLIIRCLQDNPERRPTTAEITHQLKQLSEQHPKEFQDVIQMHSQISQLAQQTVSLQQEKEEIESQLGQKIAEDVQRIPPQFVYTSTHTAEVSAAHVSPGYSQSSHEDTQHTQEHIPYDPNLVCPYCNKQFRMGEIQRFKRHVNLCGRN